MNRSVWSPRSRSARSLTLFVLASGFVACMASWPRAAAQATAQISGQVTDSTGAVVADAQVRVTDADTSAVRTTQIRKSQREPRVELATRVHLFYLELDANHAGRSEVQFLGVVSKE